MKKRILGIILAALMILASTVSVFATDDVHPGDVNLDRKLSLGDCSLILKYIAKWDISQWTFSEKNADYNGDGRINISDVSLILRRCANPWYPGKTD